MQDFAAEGGRPNVWGSVFEGRNEILLLGKALNFKVILQKYALKLIKIWKIIEKIREKWKISENIYFSSGTVGKLRNIIWRRYNGGVWGRAPQK